MPRKYNGLNSVHIDLSKSGICAICGRRFTDPLCTHATPEQIEFTIKLDASIDAEYEARAKMLRAARSYKNHHVPDQQCPKCGGLLIVRARHLKQRGKDDYVTEFVSCSRFETNGCKYTSPLTDDIRAAIDAHIAITANTAPEF